LLSNRPMDAMERAGLEPATPSLQIRLNDVVRPHSTSRETGTLRAALLCAGFAALLASGCGGSDAGSGAATPVDAARGFILGVQAGDGATACAFLAESEKKEFLLGGRRSRMLTPARAKAPSNRSRRRWEQRPTRPPGLCRTFRLAATSPLRAGRAGRQAPRAPGVGSPRAALRSRAGSSAMRGHPSIPSRRRPRPSSAPPRAGRA
jgi:hypothetical protein